MKVALPQNQPDERIGRYAIFGAIAQGGMARVHLARLMGPEGFSRVVAVKRLHAHFLEDPEFKQMFVAEARLAARVRHPNVVPVLDVLAQSGELLIVMEYVHGESLQGLLRAVRSAQASVPLPVACAIMLAALQGIHAAHEARNERGEPLNIVHRDVSPHNVLVGVDGVTRVLDFGVAKAVQAQDAKPGLLKGKFSYMAPEVIGGAPATRQSDVFSAATVFWEFLAGRKLFDGATERERVRAVLHRKYPSPRELVPNVPVALECIVMKGLDADPVRRYATALDMAIAIERYATPTSQRVIGEWVSQWAADALKQRAELIHQIETSYIAPRSSSEPPPLPRVSVPPPLPPGPVSMKAPLRVSMSPIFNPGRAISSPGIPTRAWVIGISGLVLAGLGVWLLAGRSDNPSAEIPTADQVAGETPTARKTTAKPNAPKPGPSSAAATEPAATAPPTGVEPPKAPPPTPAPVPQPLPPVAPAPPPPAAGYRAPATAKPQNGSPSRAGRPGSTGPTKDYLPNEL